MEEVNYAYGFDKRFMISRDKNLQELKEGLDENLALLKEVDS